jgi:hypothetical protein
MEELVEVSAFDADLTLGECQIASSDVNARFPLCDDASPQPFSILELSPECPDDLMLEIDVAPPGLTMEVGESRSLRDAFTVTLTGRTPEGESIGSTEVEPFWSSADGSVAQVSRSGYVTAVAEGETTLAGAISRDPAMPTAEADLVVGPNQGIEGEWLLSPVSQSEQCRYAGGDWFDEDSFTAFTIALSRPSDDEVVEATIPGTGSVLTGTWDEATRVLNLSIDTTAPAECDYLFYESDVCGDAVGCSFVSCRNATSVMGVTSLDARSLEADTEWYYSVTFSFEFGDGTIGENTWECQGEAHLVGMHL